MNVTQTASLDATQAPIQPTQSTFTASLSEIAGGVLARKAQESSFADAQNGYVLQVLGQVQTQTGGRTRLDFSTGSLLRLGPNTLFTLQPPQEDSKGLLIRVRLEVGRLWVILQGGSLEVETKSGVAAVRGSYMSVSYDPDSGETRITCLEGNCSLATPGGSVQITAGQTAIVTGAGQPQIGDMDQKDVQDWLDNNPEAKLVVPTSTVTPTASETPVPTSTPTVTQSGAGNYSSVVVASPTPKKKKKSSGSNGTQSTDEQSPPALPVPTVVISGVEPVLAMIGKSSTAFVTLPHAPSMATGRFGSISSSLVGQPVNVYVSVLPASGGPVPTGTVDVMADGVSFCTATLDAAGSATCVGGIPMAGTLSLVANYPGDGSYSGAQSAPVSYTVYMADTSTTIVSQVPNPGITVTFKATVSVYSPGAGVPTGSVTFTADSGESCTAYSAPWKCKITFTNTGFCSRYVSATYSGDLNFNSSDSGVVTQYVGPCG